MESGGKAIGWYPLNELRNKLGLQLASVDDENGSDWVLLGVDSKDTPLFAVDITKHVRFCCFKRKITVVVAVQNCGNGTGRLIS